MREKILLLIDLGNSSIKWRLEKPSETPARGCQQYSEGNGLVQLVKDWLSLPLPGRILVSNVAGNLMAESLRKISRILWKIKPEFSQVTSPACGITSHYAQPEKLGVDRWLVMIAAFQQIAGPVMIADCGTAVTVDLVDQAGRQEEGIILPGLQIMYSSLIQRTAIPQIGNAQAMLTEDTQQAIVRGSLLAIRAVIDQMFEKGNRKHHGRLRLLLTGGDAEVIGKGLSSSYEIKPELVLDGLKIMQELCN